MDKVVFSLWLRMFLRVREKRHGRNDSEKDIGDLSLFDDAQPAAYLSSREPLGQSRRLMLCDTIGEPGAFQRADPGRLFPVYSVTKRANYDVETSLKHSCRTAVDRADGSLHP